MLEFGILYFYYISDSCFVDEKCKKCIICNNSISDCIRI